MSLLLELPRQAAKTGDKLIRFIILVSIYAVLLLLGGMTSAQTDSQRGFIQVSVDNDTPYVGDNIRYRIEYFDPGQYVDQVINLPGFRNLGMVVEGDVIQNLAVVNNASYVVFQQEFTFIPLVPGPITIEPVNIFVPETPFQIEQNIASVSIQLQVSPLPQPVPSHYIGVNGQYTLELSINASAITSQMPLQLTAQLSGTNNISLARIPNISGMPNWRVTLQEDTYHNTTGQLGIRTLRWLLLPLVSGTVLTPVLSMSTFDSMSGTYVSIQSQTFAVDVSDELTQTASDENSPNAIAHINWPQHLSTGLPSPSFIGWLLAPGFVALLWAVRRYKPRTRFSSVPVNKQLARAAQLPPLQGAQLLADLLTHLLEQKETQNALPDEKTSQDLKECLEIARNASYQPFSKEDFHTLLKRVKYTITHTRTRRDR